MWEKQKAAAIIQITWNVVLSTDQKNRGIKNECKVVFTLMDLLKWTLKFVTLWTFFFFIIEVISGVQASRHANELATNLTNKNNNSFEIKK